MTFAELRDHWTKLVGHQIAATTTPFMLTSSGTLIIQTASPVLTSELEKHGPIILGILPAVDGQRVREIRWAYAPPERPRRERFARGAR